MYWQKRFNKEDPDKAIKEEILELHERNKDHKLQVQVEQ